MLKKYKLNSETRKSPTFDKIYSRWLQLFVLLPFLGTVGGVLFPGFLIASNVKMKNKFLEDLVFLSGLLRATLCKNKVGAMQAGTGSAVL